MVKIKSFLPDGFLSAHSSLLFIQSSLLDEILGLCTKELLQTPSDLGDTVSQSRQPVIFHENPVSQSNEISLRFWEGFDVVDFQTLYLRAQMEFEGVLWCKVRVF